MEATSISNDDSILESIKKLLGISDDCESFDADVLMYINGVFLDLHQIGIGPEEGFSILDNSSVWNDFSEDALLLNSVKPYIYLKVRLIFDPPTSASVITSFEKMIDRFEWRINMIHENEITEIENKKDFC